MTRLVFQTLLAVVVGFLIMFGSVHVGCDFARADTPTVFDSAAGAPYRPLFSSTETAASAGSGSDTATPADKLHDPLTDPGAAFDDVKAARKLGWPVALLAALIMLTRLLAAVGKNVDWLAWLGKGRAAFVLAGAATIAIAGFNSLALGGTWYAAALAAALAGFALLHPVSPPAPEQARP